MTDETFRVETMGKGETEYKKNGKNERGSSKGRIAVMDSLKCSCRWRHKIINNLGTYHQQITKSIYCLSFESNR